MTKTKIRFKGYGGEWKSIDFCESFKLLKNNTLSRAELAEEGKIANIHYGDVLIKYAECIDTTVDKLTYIIDNEVGKNLLNNGALKKGDIIFADAAEDTTVGKCSELICNDNEEIVSGLHTIACRPQIDTAERYLGYYLNSPAYHNQLLPHIQGTKISSISRKAINTTKVVIPSEKEEQQTIASYFTSLDAQISASTSRLASLKQIKAASLQAMFPQDGETMPKVRFKGFDGEWKKVSFKDFTFHAGTKNRDNLPLESYSISNEFGFIPQNEQFENGGTMTQADKRMYYIVSSNSFAYNPARINVGSLGYYEGNEDVIVSSLYEVFKTDDTICDRFLLYWFKTNIFQKMIEQFQEGGVRLYFFYDKMCKCSLKRPSLAEQQAIASYFTSLDHQISLQAQRLEKLKQIKAACLEKMFV